MQYIVYYDEKNAAKTDHYSDPWSTIGIGVGYNWHGKFTKILVEKMSVGSRIFIEFSFYRSRKKS